LANYDMRYRSRTIDL